MKKNLLSLEMFLFEVLKRNRAFCKRLVPLFVVLMGFSVSAQELVADLNQMENQIDNEYTSIIDVSGTLYFVSENTLWKSDGTLAGTVMIRSFTQIGELTNVAGTLYFSADDGISGVELWMTAGTAAGTVMIKDIQAGSADSDPQQLTTVNSDLYFVANDGTTGRELWKTNGTAEGTTLVKDILRVSGSSNPLELTAMNDRLFFVANNGENGYELWRSDGTANGTNIVRDIYGGTRNSSRPEHLTNINGVLYFSASLPATGRELWKSDGTNAGTVRIKDIAPGGQSSLIDNLVNVNGTLFFSANDRTYGEELWKSNGTTEGTVMVKDLTPGSKGSGYRGAFTGDMTNFTAINGKLYFTAHDANRYYIWKSDGTAAGTITLMEATSIGITQLQPDFTLYKNDIYFFHGGGDYPVLLELWRESAVDGSLQKIKTLELNDYYESFNQPLVKSGNHLYLTARQGDRGFALYQSNGTTNGTKFFIDTYKQTNQSSNPTRFVKIGSLIYFVTDFDFTITLNETDGSTEGTRAIMFLESIGELVNGNGRLYFSGREPGEDNWTVFRWDPATEEATKLLLPPSEGHPQPHQLTAVGDKLFFLYQHELWVTDGLTTASVIETDFNPITLFGEGSGGQLYLSAASTMHGTELWKTDGTTAGTVLVRDINPGADNSFASEPAFMNTILYFKAYSSNGIGLWRSDGTTSGTYLIKDRDNGADPSTTWDDMRGIVAVNGTLYFTAMDGGSLKWWLWKTNGTTAGTGKVKLIPAPVYLLDGNDKLFFVAWDGTYGLWRSEGTDEGTFKVRSFGDGCCISSLYDYLTINNIFYFTFQDENLWRSDGSVCGTFAIPEQRNNPFPIEAIGNEILFGMNDVALGRELFKFDVAGQTPCSTAKTMASVARAGSDAEGTQGASAEAISQYPNPFKSNFSLLVNGLDGETYRAKIMTTNNVQVEDLHALMYNQPYDLGTSWRPGLYLLIIQERDKMTVRKIVKN